MTTTTPLPTATPVVGRGCGGLNLPMGGVISMPDGELVTLTAAAAFRPVCTPVSPPAIIANGGGGSVTNNNPADLPDPGEDGTTYSSGQDPFYASTFPQCYALAATTVVAYTLVIMLFVTPRSFLDGGVVVLGSRGFTNGGTGPTIGGRPWLQKFAALAVAISLTIASSATFQVAEEQYAFGVQNAKKLQMEVLGGTELKVIRIISNTFLWLAQAQTLIRLFPRQREKIIIKWTAFALITLDVIFQSLNSFKYEQGVARPGSFQHPVPALSYLFALSLNVLYAAWVIYYSLLKKRYAYWHPQMKNMVLVAALSLTAILIPIVFFILDIVQPDFTGWGEYVRWVGAAAASVIVWEWVERIEALEREEKKDGILGREVFDGDEMLEIAGSNHNLRRRRKELDDEDGGGPRFDSGPDESPSTAGGGHKWPTVTAITARYKPRSRGRSVTQTADSPAAQPSNRDRMRILQPPLWPARPPQAVTPVSRTDTSSAASTVYAVRYHPLTETTSRTTPPPTQQGNAPESRSSSRASSRHRDDVAASDGEGDTATQPAQNPPTPANDPSSSPLRSSSRWRSIKQKMPLQRVRPVDVESAALAGTGREHGSRREGHGRVRSRSRGVGSTSTSTSTSTSNSNSNSNSNNSSSSNSKWDIRARFEEFAATQADRLREKFRTTPDTDSLPVRVIPAPPRRGAALAQLLEEEEEAAAGATAGTAAAGAAEAEATADNPRSPPPSALPPDDQPLPYHHHHHHHHHHHQPPHRHPPPSSSGYAPSPVSPSSMTTTTPSLGRPNYGHPPPS